MLAGHGQPEELGRVGWAGMAAPGKGGRPVRGGTWRPWMLPVSPVGTVVPSPTPGLHCSPMTSCFLTSKSQIPVPLLRTLSTSWVKCLCLSMQGHLVQRGGSLTQCWLLASRLHSGTQVKAPSRPGQGPGRDLGSPGGPHTGTWLP